MATLRPWLCGSSSWADLGPARLRALGRPVASLHLPTLPGV